MFRNNLDKDYFSKNSRFISIYKKDYINHNISKSKVSQKETTIRLSKIPKRFIKFLVDIKLKLEKRKKVYCI